MRGWRRGVGGAPGRKPLGAFDVHDGAPLCIRNRFTRGRFHYGSPPGSGVIGSRRRSLFKHVESSGVELLNEVASLDLDTLTVFLLLFIFCSESWKHFLQDSIQRWQVMKYSNSVMALE